MRAWLGSNVWPGARICWLAGSFAEYQREMRPAEHAAAVWWKKINKHSTLQWFRRMTHTIVRNTRNYGFRISCVTYVCTCVSVRVFVCIHIHNSPHYTQANTRRTGHQLTTIHVLIIHSSYAYVELIRYTMKYGYGIGRRNTCTLTPIGGRVDAFVIYAPHSTSWV